jgi:hypothetical protein
VIFNFLEVRSAVLRIMAMADRDLSIMSARRPHGVQTIRGHKDRTGVSPDSQSTQRHAYKKKITGSKVSR